MADDNKPLKYMRYAIGEIVLVVIGILIALQINTWNEEKKDRGLEIEFLKRLKSDLVTDSTYYSRRIKDSENLATVYANKHKVFLDYFEGLQDQSSYLIDSMLEN